MTRFQLLSAGYCEEIETPELRAVGLNQQEQAAAVCKLVRARSLGLVFLALSSLRDIGGIAPVRRRPKYPQNTNHTKSGCMWTQAGSCGPESPATLCFL